MHRLAFTDLVGARAIGNEEAICFCMRMSPRIFALVSNGNSSRLSINQTTPALKTVNKRVANEIYRRISLIGRRLLRLAARRRRTNRSRYVLCRDYRFNPTRIDQNFCSPKPFIARSMPA